MWFLNWPQKGKINHIVIYPGFRDTGVSCSDMRDRQPLQRSKHLPGVRFIVNYFEVRERKSRAEGEAIFSLSCTEDERSEAKIANKDTEAMDVDPSPILVPVSRSKNQENFYPSSNHIAITTQPGRTQTPNPDQIPPGHNHNQEDLYTSGDCTLVPAPSDTSQTSTSESKSSDTKPKKRETNLLRGNSVSQEQDTVDDNLNPSAPRDIVKVYMTVDWPGEIPQKWKSHLQKALQTWCSHQESNEGQKCSGEVVELLDGGLTAEVEITPFTALKDMSTATLTFKQLGESAKVHFQKEKPKSLNKDSSPK
ncbi:E3 ubiquitin-protein ligase DTX3L-like, partial [Clarias magur]